MPKIFMIALAAFGVAALQSAMVVPPADAAIKCRDGFQNSGGNWISTPYCNDEHLAEIARKHGVKVSGHDMRYDWGKKEDVCRLLRGFPSVRDYCPPEGGPRGRY
jgi:hypothetical protein